MSDERGEALEVLRGIWSAQGQTSADLEEAIGAGHGHGKSCKAMRNVGFGDTDDEDLRAAWRGRLERDGKLRPGGTSVADLVRDRSAVR